MAVDDGGIIRTVAAIAADGEKQAKRKDEASETKASEANTSETKARGDVAGTEGSRCGGAAGMGTGNLAWEVGA